MLMYAIFLIVLPLELNLHIEMFLYTLRFYWDFWKHKSILLMVIYFPRDIIILRSLLLIHFILYIHIVIF